MKTSGAGGTSRPGERIAGEAAQAQRSFHRALRDEQSPQVQDKARRSAAVQTFFVANAGRS
ncbi:MAG TPA: P-type conjugative transfer protein TrbL, partial [Phenylobacterium sp.]|nr:P-type conjugative transfer protein TrbL [Phenylobacterium sp.]